MLKVQAGNITSLNGGTDVRIVDSFFKGGEFIRGFAPSGIGPRDMTPGFRQDALGGTTYVGGTAELQFPVPYVPEDLGFKGALFADAGTLFDVGDLSGTTLAQCPKGTPLPVGGCNYFDDKTFRASIGLSIIWQGSPLGPLRFDFGFPIMKEDYDDTQIFRFSGGTSF
jgi:outer membrane protein insertion porin family